MKHLLTYSYLAATTVNNGLHHIRKTPGPDGAVAKLWTGRYNVRISVPASTRRELL